VIRIVTDATPWIAYFSGEGCPPLELALSAGAVVVPPLVCTELLGNSLGTRERKLFEDLLLPLTPPALHPEHWSRAGQLKAQLEKQNQFLSARDVHVLQCAIDEQAVLLSADPLLKGLKSTGVTVQIW
jgi:predicted nucleic acid-binding protein